jgi:hypothetical protein
MKQGVTGKDALTSHLRESPAIAPPGLGALDRHPRLQAIEYSAAAGQHRATAKNRWPLPLPFSHLTSLRRCKREIDSPAKCPVTG